MKRCPTCQRVYEDDGMSYCLEDGAALVHVSATSSDPGATVIIPASHLTDQSPAKVLPAGEVPSNQPAPQFAQPHHAPARAVPAERKGNALPWILGAALVLGLSGIVIALVMTRSRESNANQIAQNTTPVPEATANTTLNQIELPTGAPSPASEAQDRPQTSTNQAQPSPTPNRTPTPGRTPATVTPDEPPPPPKPTPTPAPERRAPISGGVLNGKAISKPQPAYPAIARAARASGTVTVQVIVDEGGKVISARAVSGHPLLQQSAVQAAYQARFSPTLLSGQPVKVTGVITYNFVVQ
ncbi:MAG: periplasmic protein TonB [Acidobacteriota bacterium]|nr:periplasmic protein TonB [Acidobacteriota bacterium]